VRLDVTFAEEDFFFHTDQQLRLRPRVRRPFEAWTSPRLGTAPLSADLKKKSLADDVGLNGASKGDGLG
jgi:hypothetical protein